MSSVKPFLLLRLRTSLKRLVPRGARVPEPQPAEPDWHAMLLRAEAADRDRRLAEAERALNRLQ